MTLEEKALKALSDYWVKVGGPLPIEPYRSLIIRTVVQVMGVMEDPAISETSMGQTALNIVVNEWDTLKKPAALREIIIKPHPVNPDQRVSVIIHDPNFDPRQPKPKKPPKAN